MTVAKDFHTSATSFASSSMAHKSKSAYVIYKVWHTGTPSYLAELVNPYVDARTLLPSICTFLALICPLAPLISYCSTNGQEFSPFLHSFITNISFTPTASRKASQTHALYSAFNNPEQLPSVADSFILK